MLRLGVVDFDSSHCVEFTRRINHVGVTRDQFVDRDARVVLGCPGTSMMSPERIAGHTEQVRACGVEIVATPEEMLGRIDAVLVLSICGQSHLASARPFLTAGVPTFVDKPFACSLSDAEELVGLAADSGALMWSSSALRFAEEVVEFSRRLEDIGPLYGVISHGPAKRADGNPGLFHYGIHAVEILLTLMGSDCERVTTTHCAAAEHVTGHWSNGRVATVRGVRTGATAYGFLAFCEHGVIHQPVSTAYSYRNLGRAIVESFQSGQPAVEPAVTLELTRFVLAALASEERGGEPVELSEVL